MKEYLNELLKTGFKAPKLAERVIELRQRRADGISEKPEEHEIHGENPGLMLSSLLFDNEEMREKDGRLDELRDFARKNKQSIFMISAIGGAIFAAMGSWWMFEHIKDKKADITQRNEE